MRKKLTKQPYRGIMKTAADVLGLTGANAARIASNRYRRGHRDAVAVVAALIKKREKAESRRIAKLVSATATEDVV